MPKDLAIRTAGTLFVFLLGILVGVSAPQKEASIQEALPNQIERTSEPVVTETDDTPMLVVSSEKTCWVDRYTVCGHEYIKGRDEDVSVLSRERLLALYPEVFALDAATGERVMLERDVEGFCTNHVLLKLTGDKLCVYCLDESTNELRELAGIDTDIPQFNYQILSELTEGVLLDNMAQVDAYLEGVES